MLHCGFQNSVNVSWPMHILYPNYVLGRSYLACLRLSISTLTFPFESFISTVSSEIMVHGFRRQVYSVIWSISTARRHRLCADTWLGWVQTHDWVPLQREKNLMFTILSLLPFCLDQCNIFIYRLFPSLTVTNFLAKEPKGPSLIVISLLIFSSIILSQIVIVRLIILSPSLFPQLCTLTFFWIGTNYFTVPMNKQQMKSTQHLQDISNSKLPKCSSSF